MITHITTPAAWEAAQREGLYRADSLETEGFIHFSRPEQLLATAERYYAGQSGLLVLYVDAERCGDALRVEPVVRPTGAIEHFPHLYAPLEVTAVIEARPLELDDEGRFRLPG